MKAFFTERNIVVILFVLVLVTFSLAQEDSKKMEQMYSGSSASTISAYVAGHLQNQPVQVLAPAE